VNQLEAEKTSATDATQALQDATKVVEEIAAAAQAAATPDIAPAGPIPSAQTDRPLESEHVAPPPELRRLLAIEVPVIVQLGTRRMSVAEVMRFSVGAIIEFQKSADEDLDLLANNKPIGKGHAVKVGENFGIKLTTVGPVKETIRKLGGGQ
jgi:flagellar motor switch protein FliN/FliY